MFVSGSYSIPFSYPSFVRETSHSNVSGIICMSPIAPAELSAFELNELSTLIVEYMMYSGTPYSVEYFVTYSLYG